MGRWSALSLWLSGLLDRYEHLRQLIFIANLLLHLGSLVLIIPLQPNQFRPDFRLPMLVGLGLYCLVLGGIYLLSRVRPPLAYGLYLVVMALASFTMFMLTTIKPMLLIGAQTLHMVIVLFVALILLSARWFIVFSTAITVINSIHFVVVNLTSIRDSTSGVILISYTTIIFAFYALLMVMSLAIEHYRAQTRSARDELACQNRELEAKVERRTRIIERQHDYLIQSAKLEALGRLAGGIAHDFNNLLMSIAGNASLIFHGDDKDGSTSERLGAIQHCVESGSNLTAHLLGIARSRSGEVQLTELGALCRESATMFGRMHKELVILNICAEQLPLAEVDRSQIEIMLLNLFINASHAMPNGGEIRVEVALAELSDEQAQSSGVPPGSYLEVTVADTGVGMDEDTRTHIFEPFFTAHHEGGTGLGLASVQRTVKNHNGHIEVSSQPGQGTSFHIFLPASEELPQQSTQHTSIQLRQGSETVLVVDDEEMILDVTQAMLGHLGYEVVLARNTAEALGEFERNGDIKLVILDMIMPGESGGEIMCSLKASFPEVKVLLSSGFDLGNTDELMALQGCDGFLQKPYSLSDLSVMLEDLFET